MILAFAHTSGFFYNNNIRFEKIFKMAKNIKKKEVIEGSFMGIEAPKFEHFDIALMHSIYTEKTPKLLKEIIHDDNFSIRIIPKNVSQSFFKEIQDNLSAMVSPSYVKIDYHRNEFLYYTGQWTGDIEAKKKNLTNMMEYLGEFEKDYANNFANAKAAFEEGVKNPISYVDPDIAVKYHPQMNAFVVVALRFLQNPGLFKVLAGASEKMGVMEDFPEVTPEFFSDLVTIKGNKKHYGKLDKKTFIIRNADYQKIKGLVETKLQKKQEFYQEQNEFVAQYDKNPFFYDKENILNFKINLNRETNCFEFYCSGYKRPSPSPHGNIPERSVLGKWALNFLLSRPRGENENIDSLSYEERDGEIEENNTYKILLDVQPQVEKTLKKLVVPANDLEKLRQIYDRFMKDEEFYTRPFKTLKLHDFDLTSEALAGAPGIYFNSKGKPFMVFSIGRIHAVSDQKKDETGEWIPTGKKAKDASVTYKAIALDYEEANYFINEHEWAEKIKANSIRLTVNAIMTRNGELINWFSVNQEEKEKIFSKAMLNAKLVYELENEEQEDTPVSKMKI